MDNFAHEYKKTVLELIKKKLNWALVGQLIEDKYKKSLDVELPENWKFEITFKSSDIHASNAAYRKDINYFISIGFDETTKCFVYKAMFAYKQNDNISYANSDTWKEITHTIQYGIIDLFNFDKVIDQIVDEYKDNYFKH